MLVHEGKERESQFENCKVRKTVVLLAPDLVIQVIFKNANVGGIVAIWNGDECLRESVESDNRTNARHKILDNVRTR